MSRMLVALRLAGGHWKGTFETTFENVVYRDLGPLRCAVSPLRGQQTSLVFLLMGHHGS